MARRKKAAAGREAAAALQGNAIPFLIQLSKTRGPSPPTTVAGEIEADPKNAVALAKRLAARGLVDLKEVGEVAGKPIYEVSILPRGRQLLALLEPAIRFLEEPETRKGGRERGP